MLHERVEGNRCTASSWTDRSEEFYGVRLLEPRSQTEEKVHLGDALDPQACYCPYAYGAQTRREALKRRLSVLLAAAMMLSTTVAVAGPALAIPQGNNGNHYGDIQHEDNRKHIGAGAGAGKYSNFGLYRRGLR